MSKLVKLLVLSFRDQDQEKIWKTIKEQADEDTDLILLPELWMGDRFPMQSPGSELLERASWTARELHSYLVCPAYVKEGNQRLNSAVVFDRNGKCCYRYDKVFPYWDELKLIPPCSPGREAGVFQTDFGVCGVATCFDVNFPELWAELESRGAELILWPSDYSGGRALQAHAMTHHYYIVSATRYGDTAVYDITGDELLYNRSCSVTVSKVTLDLDRGLFHENFNMEKCANLLREQPGVFVERTFPREQWFLLAGTGKTSAGDLAREYGMEELRDYIRRSRSVSLPKV